MGRKKKYKTVEELQKAVDAYFESCEFGGKPVTISGLCLYLGVDRTTLWNYQDIDGRYLNTIKQAKLRCENYVEEALYKGDIAPNAGIFALKNYGWTDKQEIDQRLESDNTVHVVLDGELDEWAK